MNEVREVKEVNEVNEVEEMKDLGICASRPTNEGLLQ